MIELQELRNLDALARHASFNKAARALHMSQPALTKKIRRLEDRLGVTLFHRSPRGVQPTAFGAYLLENGRDLIEQSEILQRQVQMMAGMELGELKIGVGPAIEQDLLSDVLARFVSKHGQVTVNILVDSAAHLLTLLKDGQLDIAAGAFDPVDSFGDLEAVPLMHQNLVFAARPGHPLLANRAPGEAVKLRDMLAYPLATPEIPTSVRKWLQDGQADPTADLKLGIRSENYGLLRTAVSASDQITGGPHRLFDDDFATGRLVPLPLGEKRTLDLSVVARPEAMHAPPVKRIREIFLRVAAELG